MTRLVWKMWLVAKKVTTDCYPLRHTPRSYLYTDTYLSKFMLQLITCHFFQQLCCLRFYPSSTDWKYVPFNAPFTFAKKKKFHGARSDEFEICSRKRICLFAKNWFTDTTLCTGSSSWCRIHESFFQESSLVFLTFPLNSISSSLSYFLLTVWLSDSHSILVTPLLSRKERSALPVFSINLLILVFSLLLIF